jgi:hypothetical protein
MANNNDNQGALFINKRKQKENHPDQRGEITLSKELLRELVEMAKSGKEPKVAVAGWNKMSKAGNPYISLSVQPFVEYDKSKAAPKPAPAAKKQEDFNDDEDIPF